MFRILNVSWKFKLSFISNNCCKVTIQIKSRSNSRNVLSFQKQNNSQWIQQLIAFDLIFEATLNIKIHVFGMRLLVKFWSAR